MRLKELGFQVMSIDIRRSVNPTFCQDILTWNYQEYPPGFLEVIGASVPCTEYSRAKTKGSRNFQLADSLVAKTLEIIQYFQPKFWWVENPRTGCLKDREIVKGIPYLDLDYCQFSDWGYQKPTRFWACKLISDLPSVLCDKPTCKNCIAHGQGVYKHVEILGGNRQQFSTSEKGRIPSQVVNYLLQRGSYGKSRRTQPFVRTS